MDDITRWVVAIHTTQNVHQFEIPLSPKAERFLRSVHITNRAEHMINRLIRYYRIGIEVEHNARFNVGISMQVGPYATGVVHLNDFPSFFKHYIESTEGDPMQIAIYIRNWMKNYDFPERFK